MGKTLLKVAQENTTELKRTCRKKSIFMGLLLTTISAYYLGNSVIDFIEYSRMQRDQIEYEYGGHFGAMKMPSTGFFVDGILSAMGCVAMGTWGATNFLEARIYRKKRKRQGVSG